MEETSIKSAIQKIVSSDVVIMEAKVTDSKDITIIPTNDEKLILDEDDLMIPDHVEIKEGETVYLLVCNEKSNYFVLGRKKV